VFPFALGVVAQQKSKSMWAYPNSRRGQMCVSLDDFDNLQPTHVGVTQHDSNKQFSDRQIEQEIAKFAKIGQSNPASWANFACFWCVKLSLVDLVS